MTDTFRIAYTPLTEKQKEQVEYVKRCGDNLLSALNSCDGAHIRYICMAKEYLEIAVMLAVKGITTS